MESLLKVEQVAALLNVPRARAYELIRQGLLPAVRLGKQVRVHPAQLEGFIANGGQPLPGGWRNDPGA